MDLPENNTKICNETRSRTTKNSTDLNKPVVTEDRWLIRTSTRCEEGYILDFTGNCTEAFNR